MNINEIHSLINIRDYVVRSIDNYSIDKKDIKQLQSMVLLIDKKIVSMLLADDFKSYVNFENAQAVIAQAAENNNIKSGMKK